MGIVGVSNSEKLEEVEKSKTTNDNSKVINLTNYYDLSGTETYNVSAFSNLGNAAKSVIEDLKEVLESIKDFTGDVNRVIRAAEKAIMDKSFDIDLNDIKYDKDNNTITIGDSNNSNYIVIRLDSLNVAGQGELIYEKHWSSDDRSYITYVTADGKEFICSEYNDIYSDGTRKISNFDDDEYYYVNEKLEDITSYIFGEWSIEQLQYGGRQESFRENNEELVKDPRIQSIIKEYWPDATEEEMSMLLYKICNVGCGYTACVNTIFLDYQGREEEFEQVFGFPMYIIKEFGKVDYNYEYLILEYFLYVNAYNDDGKLYEISDLYGNVDENVEDAALGKDYGGTAEGTGKEDQISFSKFLKEKYNISVDVDYVADEIGKSLELEVGSAEYDRLYNDLKNRGIDIEYGTPLYDIPRTNEELAKVIKKYFDEGKQVVINGKDYELSGDSIENHSVEVVEITENGEIIVSSWGNRYILDITDINDDYWITIIDYN